MDTFLKDYRKRIQTADALLEDGADQAVIQGKELKVVVEKDLFRICVYDKEGTMILPVFYTCSAAREEWMNHTRGGTYGIFIKRNI